MKSEFISNQHLQPGILHYSGRVPIQQIPKILHFVWVGEEAKCPHHCIDSWRVHHPDWVIKVWGNDDYNNRHWRLKSHMQDMWNYELNGVADMMRYEILLENGGIALDADSICLKPLPEWILECEAVAATENGLFRTPLIACGFQGTKPRNQFYETLVRELESNPNALFKTILGFRHKRYPAWKSVGPRYLTRIYQREAYSNLTILPGHFFYPEVGKDGYAYTGGGPVYAYQLWGSTFSGY
jgi:mannosyltransferase OCH1-like enzyme